jgi:hypothetical protein
MGGVFGPTKTGDSKKTSDFIDENQGFQIQTLGDVDQKKIEMLTDRLY